MKKQLKGKQSFYDDKQRENVVSYYLMEDQEHTMYGVELEKYQEETNVIEWDAVPSISESMELVDRVIHNLIKYKIKREKQRFQKRNQDLLHILLQRRQKKKHRHS